MARSLGIILVLISTLFYSLSGVFTKLISSDAWTIIGWRGMFSACIIAIYVLWAERRKPLPARFQMGWQGWLIASISSVGGVAFISAFKLTYVANVAVIYATAPFVSALLEWMLVRQRPSKATLLAALVSLIGVGIMVFAGLGVGSALGNLMALVMTLAMSFFMVLIRVFKDTPVVLTAAASSLQLAVIACFMTNPLTVSRQDLVLLVLFGLSFAVAIVLLIEGTRRIPAAESALLGAAETPLAPLFAFMILAEVPPLASLFGGGIVLFAVLAHALRGLGATRKLLSQLTAITSK